MQINQLIMNIQSIPKTMAQIAHAILTALLEGLARYGYGMVGLPYPDENPP
jgi:hypothetical protein